MESTQQTSNWAEMEMPSDDEEGHQHHPHNPENHKEENASQQTAEGGQVSITRTATTKRKPQLSSKQYLNVFFVKNEKKGKKW